MEGQSQHAASHTKAAGLNNILNNDDLPSANGHPPPHLRDSGFYSTTEPSSKHTSAASFHANGLSPAGSGYQSSLADKTPSPVTTNMTTQPIVSPSASGMSLASMVSPVSPSTERRFDRTSSIDHQGHNVATLGETLATFVGPRRESVDSRINQGFSDMRLGSSPYTSKNHSTSSIHNTMHSQRNQRPGMESASMHRISNGYQPSADRNPVEPRTVKTAPAITGPATGHIARAAEPTKGQAWAFPEEEIQRVGPPSRYNESRRSSITESIASSHFTTESRLPPGQRRLEDGADFTRVPSISNEYPPVHHHTMQHKQLSDLQAEEGNGSAGSQPYSRTPELRVSHKLAERKRRTEMKELFDTLRDLMPQERGSKASKWEILTKAINEHQRQLELIRHLQHEVSRLTGENQMLHREIHSVRAEMSGAGHAQPPPPAQAQPMAPAQSSQSATYGHDAYHGSNRPELPPLRTIHNGPESMTGVQYESPRPNGYRQERY